MKVLYRLDWALQCLFCLILGITIGYFIPRPIEHKSIVRSAREKQIQFQQDGAALLEQYLELHKAELTGESR